MDQLMADAILTAQGKPGSPLRAVFIGTLAPALSGWWHDLMLGEPQPHRYVQSLMGDRQRWDDWKEICRVNPLTKVSKEFRETLKRERAEARRDSRLKARFLSYRLNVPTADEVQVLLTVDEWGEALARDVAPRRGQPIVGVDLGLGRAWPAAVALWETGRCEAMAIAPGILSIVDQERRDGVPAGLYGKLVQSARLDIADGLRGRRSGCWWTALSGSGAAPKSSCATVSVSMIYKGRSAALPSVAHPPEENGWQGGPAATRSIPRYWQKLDARISVARRSVCRDAVDSVFGTNGEPLANGDKVPIAGFGTFAAWNRPGIPAATPGPARRSGYRRPRHRRSRRRRHSGMR